MSLDALIAKVEHRLDSLEVKPSSPSALRELLTRLDTKITEAQEKGYGIAEIVELIVGCGFATNPDDLKKQLTLALENKHKKPQPKRGKARVRKTTP